MHVVGAGQQSQGVPEGPCRCARGSRTTPVPVGRSSRIALRPGSVAIWTNWASTPSGRVQRAVTWLSIGADRGQNRRTRARRQLRAARSEPSTERVRASPPATVIAPPPACLAARARAARAGSPGSRGRSAPGSPSRTGSRRSARRLRGSLLHQLVLVADLVDPEDEAGLLAGLVDVAADSLAALGLALPWCARHLWRAISGDRRLPFRLDPLPVASRRAVVSGGAERRRCSATWLWSVAFPRWSPVHSFCGRHDDRPSRRLRRRRRTACPALPAPCRDCDPCDQAPTAFATTTIGAQGAGCGRFRVPSREFKATRMRRPGPLRRRRGPSCCQPSN